MHVDEEQFHADNEASESESEALKCENMPDMEECPSQGDESVPDSDGDPDAALIIAEEQLFICHVFLFLDFNVLKINIYYYFF